MEVKPTRAISAYIFFSIMRNAQLREEGKSQKEAMKFSGTEWNSLSEE